GEVFQLEVVPGDLRDGRFRDQADHFAALDLHSALGCFRLDRLVHHVDGRLFVVGQVHGDLYDAAGLQGDADSLDRRQSDVGGAHGVGDGLGDIQVFAGEVHV